MCMLSIASHVDVTPRANNSAQSYHMCVSLRRRYTVDHYNRFRAWHLLQHTHMYVLTRLTFPIILGQQRSLTLVHTWHESK